MFYFSQFPSFYCFSIILTLIFCSDSPKRKVCKKYGRAHGTDEESSEPGSNESSFVIPQSVEISSTSPAQSVRPHRTNSSDIPTSPNKPFPKLVGKLWDGSIPSPSHSPIVPENVQITSDEEEAAGSLFHEVPPAKGIQNLPEIATTIPIPVETSNLLTHEMIVSISKAHYLKQKENVNKNRFTWETTYSHHSCFMIPDDYNNLKRTTAWKIKMMTHHLTHMTI